MLIDYDDLMSLLQEEYDRLIKASNILGESRFSSSNCETVDSDIKKISYLINKINKRFNQ